MAVTGADAPAVSEARAAEILAAYNAGIVEAMESIESLTVRQTIYEPQADGTTKRAEAVLNYTKGEGMDREEISSELSYPSGTYSLQSLVGPMIRRSEYDVAVWGPEEKDGVACYRLVVTARVRDVDHFDGTVWVSARSLAPTRITGAVADPPFPARRIWFDKSFAPVADDLWLVRRHSGEVQARLLLLEKRGTRHIFYEDYEVIRSPA